jgi:hypothetical protein
VVLGEVDVRLALPGLPRDDAARHPDRAADRHHQRRQAVGRPQGSSRQRLEGEDDHRVPGQHGQRLAEGAVDGGLAPADRRVVEAGEVVVDQGRAVQQLDRDRGGFCHRRLGLPAGTRHGQAEPGPDACAAREDRVPDGRGQPRRAVRAFRAGDAAFRPARSASWRPRSASGARPSTVRTGCQFVV